ncbi:hypothetical protein Q5H92_05910 [Hymenobacter sp. M29]|uniref:TIGR02646 family protein n=1 Tax=Hymenobacter mellowenesis TaxID=3063995 RepID=A0ABT9A8N1_9BACT|nr:hypothetical protein [Hymenobacter sp. M29]MDO7845883.1 hypothetical protein [Hymenobacter sp. M29]
MIRISKSQPAPAPLLTSGLRHLRKLQKIQEADPPACLVPDNKLLESKDGIYNDARVKERLRADQHDKCCYCESYFSSTSYGDVEHFRPKGGYQQDAADALHKPGYYWLAYDWSNLYFACQLCNQRFKGNYFPLTDPAGRACSHTDSLATEAPLLPDPATEDPTAHLSFIADAAQPLDERGACCIWVFGLDRPELIKRRVERLKALKQAEFVAGLPMSLPLNPAIADYLQASKLTYDEGLLIVAEAKRIWEDAVLDSAEFAGMVRANRASLQQV